MSGFLIVNDGVYWSASGGLFDWTLEFVISHLSDAKAAERLREVVDNNLQSVSLLEFSPSTREAIIASLRTGLLDAAKRDLPPSETTLARLRELIDLTHEPARSE